MKAISKSKALTFGNYIAAVYDARGSRRGKAIVEHAINARLLTFRNQQHVIVS